MDAPRITPFLFAIVMVLMICIRPFLLAVVMDKPTKMVYNDVAMK